MPFSTDYEIVRLCPDHQFGDFDCGEALRNTWLRSRALSNQDSDDAQTYVAVSDGRVIGFYALALGSIVRHMLPTAVMRRNAPDPVGYVLLGQLGVDLRQQGQGLGRQLVLHGMRQATRVAELAGCRLFAVSPARDELIAYYARFGFVGVKAAPAPMLMTMRRVRQILDGVAA